MFRFKWLSVLTPFMVVGFVCLLMFSAAENLSPNAYLFEAIVGIYAITLGVATYERRCELGEKKSSLARKALAGAALLAGIWLAFGASLFAFTGVGFNQELVASVAKAEPWFSLTYSICLAYIIFTTLAVWSRYTVADGKVVLIDNWTFYPGEKYTLWPFRTYETVTVSEQLDLDMVKLLLQCKDGEFEAVLTTSVALGLKEACMKGIRQLDPNYIREQARKLVVEETVRIMAGSHTLGGLIKALTAVNIRIFVQDITVYWNGRTTVAVKVSGT